MRQLRRDIGDGLAGEDRNDQRFRACKGSKPGRRLIETLRLDREHENFGRPEGAPSVKPLVLRECDELRRGLRLDDVDFVRVIAPVEPGPQHGAAHLAGSGEKQGTP